MAKRTPAQIVILRIARSIALADKVGEVASDLFDIAKDHDIDLGDFQILDEDSEEYGELCTTKLDAVLNPPAPETFEEFLLQEQLRPGAIAYLTMPMWRRWAKTFDWPGDIEAFIQSWEDKGYLERQWENLDVDDDEYPIVDEDHPDASPFWSGTEKLKKAIERS